MPELRNVFANSTTGLQLRGASKATIQGNLFGVLPDGVSASPNTRNLVVADSTGPLPDGTPATNNVIGADVGTAGAETAACDKGCNVFAGTPSGPSINLEGSGAFEEKAATGPTTISGNFVGLDATGTGELPNTGYGILAGGADHVTIGGPTPGGANYLVGGSEAIFSGNDGDDFLALGNSIGFRANGAAATAPIGKGIYVLALTVTEEPEIDTNDIRVNGEAGIEVRFSIGKIIDNDVEGGETGIVAGFGDGGGLIAGNTVESPSAYGILVKSPDNEVRANTVVDSGGAGIGVKPPNGVTATTGNLIGGNNKERENHDRRQRRCGNRNRRRSRRTGELDRNRPQSRDAATAVSSSISKPAPTKELSRPPSLSALKTSAEGAAAEPGATIRVFRKASGEAGELQSFLAETVADGSGNWKATYPRGFRAGRSSPRPRPKKPVPPRSSRRATTPADPSDGGCKDALPAAMCAPPVSPPPSACRAARCPETTIKEEPQGESRPRRPPSSSSSPRSPARSSNASSTRASSRSADRRRPTTA